MISDTERREVARRMRGIKDTREVCRHDMCCDLWSAIFGSDYRCTGLCDECEVAVLDSLADLIEPGEPKVKCVAEVKIEGDKLDEAVHRAMAEYAGVDRDALLALADEFESGARDARAHKWNEPANAAMAIALADEYEANARRIREACGEAR